MKVSGNSQRKPHWLAWAWAALVCIPVLLGTFWYYQFGFLGWCVGYIGLLGVGGPLYISLALRHRQGESLHCPKCDYEFAYGSDVSVDHPSMCPECGVIWTEQLVKGSIRPSWARVVLWSVATVVGMLVAVYGISNSQTRLISFVPSAVLVDGVVRMRNAREYEWNPHWVELAGRTLTPSQNQRLADLLIDRMQKDSIGTGASQWLKQVLGANLVPQATVDKYLERRIRFEARVVPPDTGGTRMLELRIVDHDDMGFGDLKIVLAKAWIDPAAIELARNDGWYRTTLAFGDPEKQKKQFFGFTLPRIAESHASIRVPIPANYVREELPKSPARARATVWVFFSPQTFVGSRIEPADLVANPALDPRAWLLRTLEFDVPVDTPETLEQDTSGGSH
jgi:hypothetical protein